MENRVDFEKIFEAVKEKLEGMEFGLDNLANGFKAMKKCLKALKELCLSFPMLFKEEVMKKEVIKEVDKEIKAQPPSLLFEEEAVKGEVIEEEDNKIKIASGVLGAFSMEDVEFGEKRVARLGFEAHTMGLRTNESRSVFLVMANNMC